ncbi:metal ABC transporter permease [Persicirhabdus sediminis]|uniref:Metal ABC transporter permease n=1 Tax=Persicirhabdus sediminis TaxID=454144 RepID=A0A8J7SN18_9BACT|nr:metal ABC transporter permease [Persicirhabdus sediminis]MBK1791433.1 metal ABC transporter permease [Persicirhabdus sediminis]
MYSLTLPWEALGISAVWLVLMAFMVALPCSQVGSFLILRRMSLVGDAISHSVLPGIVIAFLFTGDLSSPWLIIGAGIAGLLVTIFIEMIHVGTRVKSDAATGIAFTALFALGVLLMQLYGGSKVDLDPDCVLYGQLDHILEYEAVSIAGLDVPRPLVTMTAVAFFTLTTMFVFYRVLVLSTFDAGLAASYGYKPVMVHYGMMFVLSIVVVAAFQSVGAILVIALLILPGAFAYMCTHKLPVMLSLAAGHALLSAVLGLYIYAWFDCNLAGAVVLAGAALLVLAWLFGPVDGQLWKWKRSLGEVEKPDDLIL